MAAEKEKKKRSRFTYIDLCRGLLFLMMTSTHTLSLIGFARDHWIMQYGLPRGWATVSFISLSGFAIGIIFFPKIDAQETTTHLMKRGREIFIVMFFSNIVMLLLKYLLQGPINTLYDLSWWIGLVTLKTPYSISSILIPTSLLLVISPIILKAIKRYSPYWTLFVLFGFSILVAFIKAMIAPPESLHHLLSILFFSYNGYFAILPFILFGGMSVVLGVLWQKHAVFISVAIVVGFGVLSLYNDSVFACWVVFYAIEGVGRLMTILAFSILLLHISLLNGVTKFFARIGEFSLFSFLLHRIVLQFLKAIVEVCGITMAKELEYFVLLGLAMGCIWVFCESRMWYPRWNEALKKIAL